MTLEHEQTMEIGEALPLKLVVCIVKGELIVARYSYNIFCGIDAASSAMKERVCKYIEHWAKWHLQRESFCPLPPVLKAIRLR